MSFKFVIGCLKYVFTQTKPGLYGYLPLSQELTAWRDFYGNWIKVLKSIINNIVNNIWKNA